MTTLDRAAMLRSLLRQLAEDRAQFKAHAEALQGPVRWLERVRPVAVRIAPPLMRLKT